MKQKPSIPKGTRDFDAAQMQKRRFIFEKIRTVFEKYGFGPLETSALENLSVLTGKYGEEGDRLLFRVLNSGDFLKKTTAQTYAEGYRALGAKIAEKGLRYDLTVPFARYVAMQRGTLVFPFKRYQMQPVWRADRPQKGRYREFYQCDADLIGTKALLGEAEIIAMIDEVFTAIGLNDYTLKINHRKILTGLATILGAKEKQNILCTIIDKLDKINLEGVDEALRNHGFSDTQIEQLHTFLDTEGDNALLLENINAQMAQSEAGKEGVRELKEIFDLCKTMGVSTEKVTFDTSLARGLSYYTGTIFEVKANTVRIGSICGGGRYDELTEMFGFPGMSGVGISFGVDRIYDVMEELALFPKETEVGTQLLLINFDAESLAYCLPLLQQARQKGIKTELYPEAAKLKKQMHYAHRKNIAYVLLAGTEEIKTETLTLKNMADGTQKTMSKADFFAFLEDKLKN